MALGYTNYAPGTQNPWGGGTIPQGANVYSQGGVNVQDYSHVDPYQAAIAGGMKWRKPEDLYSAWQASGSPSGLGPAALAAGGSAATSPASAPAGGDGGITSLYQSMLGRAPDAGGMDFYKNQLASGMSMGDLSYEFAHSPEYLASHPQSGTSQAAPASTSYDFASNPYLKPQADAIRQQQEQAFSDMNQGIRSDSVATGGFGGSRMGVAQGVAEARAATGLDSALAGMFGGAYNEDQNRGLQQYQGDQNFYTNQRGQDLQQLGIGAGLYGTGTQSLWAPYSNFASTISPFTGFGNTDQTTSQGGGGTGAVGGALGAYSIWKALMGGG